jgi:hypothetical protein
MAAQQFDFANFRGGYFTDVPDDLMENSELRTAENVYWRDGLKKRKGKASLTSFTGTILGGIRVKMASVWYSIMAFQPSASAAVELRYGTNTAFTTFTRFDADLATFTATGAVLTAGQDVQFAVLDEKVVAVNGYDKPILMRTSASSFLLDTLERYDTRTHDNDSWDAGQYFPSLTATAYVTDTADAQSATVGDFDLATTSGTSGFWFGCAHTFNRLELYGVTANSTITAGRFTWEYYGRASSGGATGWIGFTPLSIPTWSAAGNKVVEMNFPIDPNTSEILVDHIATVNSTVGSVYAMRAIVENGCSLTWAADYAKVKHTQYLTQLCIDDKPDTVATHKSHLFLGMGNWLRYSPNYDVAGLRGWREENKEYFKEGGTLLSMISHIDYLAVLLDTGIFGVVGNSWENFALKSMSMGKGPINKRSSALVNEEIYFAARDGIYGWNGSRLLKLSKHIQSDYDTLTVTNAAAHRINSEYWVSFPSNSLTFIFDPDTYRLDDVGDGRMSFYKFTGYAVNQFLPYAGAGDTGNLMAIVNATSTARLDQLETGNYDLIGSTATIPMVIRTRDMPFGNGQQNKLFRRLKLVLGQVSLTGGGVYTIKHYANNAAGKVTASAQYTAATGSGNDITYLGIPPGIDGYTYGVYIAHDSKCDARLLGFSVEVEKRKY